MWARLPSTRGEPADQATPVKLVHPVGRSILTTGYAVGAVVIVGWPFASVSLPIARSREVAVRPFGEHGDCLAIM